MMLIGNFKEKLFESECFSGLCATHNMFHIARHGGLYTMKSSFEKAGNKLAGFGEVVLVFGSYIQCIVVAVMYVYIKNRLFLHLFCVSDEAPNVTCDYRKYINVVVVSVKKYCKSMYCKSMCNWIVNSQ